MAIGSYQWSPRDQALSSGAASHYTSPSVNSWTLTSAAWNIEVGDADRVLDGGVDPFIESWLDQQMGDRGQSDKKPAD